MIPKQHYRVVRAYGPWSVGHVFTEMQGNQGRTLIARGLVEEVKPESLKKTKTLRAPADRMMRPDGQGVPTIIKG